MTRTRRRSFCPTLVLLLCVGLLAGCAGTAPARFYVLTMTPPSEPPPPAANALGIGVGPVSLPAYLDRPQIVRRESAHAIDVAEFHRWGEPLDSMVPRVLAENLAARLGTGRVFTVPSRHEQPASYSVDVDIRRFDADPDETAVLTARWRVRDAQGVAVAAETTTARQPIDGGDDATAAALSRALGQLSDAIAKAVPPGRR